MLCEDSLCDCFGSNRCFFFLFFSSFRSEGWSIFVAVDTAQLWALAEERLIFVCTYCATHLTVS